MFGVALFWRSVRHCIGLCCGVLSCIVVFCVVLCGSGFRPIDAQEGVGIINCHIWGRTVLCVDVFCCVALYRFASHRRMNGGRGDDNFPDLGIVLYCVLLYFVVT